MPPPQDVSTCYRSVDMTAFAAFATGFCQKKQRFSLQRHKAQEFCKAEFLDSLPDFLWRNLVLALVKQGVCFLNRENLCVTEFLLLLPLPQDVSTCYRSVDMTAFAAFATGFCQKKQRFSLQRHKAQEFGFAEFWVQYAGSRFGTRHAVRRLWLGAFGKAGLFRCQSRIRRLGFIN